MYHSLTVVALCFALAEQPDAAWSFLDRAYKQLTAKEYDAAIDGFRQAAAAAPDRADIRKNLAYALLKTGEQEAARDQFAEAMRLDPADDAVALEYAFLCYETHMQREARRIFNRIRHNGDPAARATAEQAFTNIDGPLGEGIARWSDVVAREPDNFSAHYELANLAEQRDDMAVAAAHYRECWRLKPAMRTLLVDLGRCWKELGKQEESAAALLAASRGAEPRAAETARGLLGSRYPYVYEFRKALELDPGNIELRRELAYLLLEMGIHGEAEAEFRRIVEASPADMLSTAQLGFLLLQRHQREEAVPLLERVLAWGADAELQDRVRTALGLPKQLRKRPEVPRRQVSDEARALAEKSLQAGYLKDALKYLTVAHETDPVDFRVILQLGQTSNLLKQDRQAVDWFALARRAPDPTIAAEAQRAYSNLKPGFTRTRTTVWALPFFSSRWKDVFTYGQVKTEINVSRFRVRPYLSMRYIGDLRGQVKAPYPQYLSEGAFVLGAGVRTSYYKGWMGWVEGGSAVSYVAHREGSARWRPDFRGGASFSRGFGHLLGSTDGVFFENHEDIVYVSRFQNSVLFYSQNKVGYSLPVAEQLQGLRAQVYFNGNATGDARRQYWANFVEAGPGVRVHWRGLPETLVFSVDWLRGAYTVNQGNPRRPNYFDVKAGFWYAFTH